MSRTAIILLVGLAIFATAFAQIGPINCTRPNEEYQCGSACQTTCQNFNQTCPIINVRCNDACYCIKGYARIKGNDGLCIPIKNCPKCSKNDLPKKEE